MAVALFHGSMLRSRAAATSAPAKFGIRPCGGNGKRATPSALSLSQTHCRAALLSAKSRAMTESGTARPGDSQGRNLLHEKPRGDPRLADVAPVEHWLPEMTGSNVFWEGTGTLTPTGSRWAASPIPISRRQIVQHSFMETSHVSLSERSPLRIVFTENEPEGARTEGSGGGEDEISAGDGRSGRLARRVWKL
jgi:hypothetical protein